MSRKIGVPILKGMATGNYQRGDAHIKCTVAAKEAVPSKETETRSCSDEDYRPEDTRNNIVLAGLRYYEDIEVERQRRVDEFNSTAKRKVNSNSPLSVIGIIKPDKELMETLTTEEQITLLERSFSIVLELLDKTEENVIYAQIHMDEGNPHIHFEIDGRTKDGRWSTTPMFQLKTKTALNETLPALLNERYGYNIEACKSHRTDTPKQKRERKQANLAPADYKAKQDLSKEIEQQVALQNQLQDKTRFYEEDIRETRKQLKKLEQDKADLEAELTELETKVEQTKENIEQAIVKAPMEMFFEKTVEVLIEDKVIQPTFWDYLMANVRTFTTEIFNRVNAHLSFLRNSRDDD